MHSGTAGLVLSALSNYQLRRSGDNQWKANVPWRDGANGLSLSLTIDDDEHGAWTDHAAHGGASEDGTLYELAERMGITPVPYETKRSYNGLDDYAEQHHVSGEVFERADWKLGKKHGRPCLIFKTNGGNRYRFIDGKEPRFINDKGYSRCWYGLDRAIEKTETTGGILYICNGEPSTVVAEYFGVPACCVTSGEKGTLPDSLMQELQSKWQGPIRIVMDCDEAGRVAGPKLAATLRGIGYDAIALDLAGGADGYDLADFCGRHLRSTVAALPTLHPLDGEPNPNIHTPDKAAYANGKHEDPPFRIYSMVDMWKQQAGLQRLWGGWMLANNVTLITGVSNVGKSPLLLSLVKGYLDGMWPDGTEIAEEMQGGNIVYCIPEGFGEQTEILRDWGVPTSVIEERIIMPALPTPGAPEIPNYQFKLDTEEGKACLNYICDQVQPRLIIVDGLRAAMTGEESSSTDCDKFIAPLVQLAVRHNAAVILSHHLVKGSEVASQGGTRPSMDWIAGSRHLVAAARSAWIVDNPDPDNLAERRITLVKAAAGPRGQQMAFRMFDPADGLLFISNIPEPAPRNKKEQAQRFIMRELESGRKKADTLFEQMEGQGLSMSRRTFDEARAELKKNGQIDIVNIGIDYYLELATEEGEEVDELADIIF